MRTPTWEQSPGALAALLNSGAPLAGKEDAYTITLRSGVVLQWSGADAGIQIGSTLHTVGPVISRTRVRFAIGLSVDQLTVTLHDNTRNPVLIGGQPLLAAARAGALTNARLVLQRAFWGEGSNGPVGAIRWFTGFVDDVGGDRFGLTLKVSSYTKLLNVTVPRDVYQSTCLNSLYDPRCGKSRAAYTVTAAASSATDAARTTFTASSLSQAAGWFSLGVIECLTGANAGLWRTVKLHAAGGVITVLQPWPFAVAAGDTFALEAGCDKLLDTCDSAKFNNRLRFRGQPFIPQPETVL